MSEFELEHVDSTEASHHLTTAMARSAAEEFSDTGLLTDIADDTLDALKAVVTAELQNRNPNPPIDH